MWKGCPLTSILPPTMCARIRSRTMLSFGFVINLVPSSGNNLVPTSGGQIWYPLLGAKFGTHFWAPNLVPTSGATLNAFFLLQTLSTPGLAFVSATPACPPHFHPPRSHPPPRCATELGATTGSAPTGRTMVHCPY